MLNTIKQKVFLRDQFSYLKGLSAQSDEQTLRRLVLHMRTRHSDASFASAALVALLRVATSCAPAKKRFLCRVGALNQLLCALRTFPSQEKMAEVALLVLAHLAPSSSRSALRMGALEEVLRCMEDFAASAAVQVAALLCLERIGQSAEAADLLLEANASALMRRACLSSRRDPSLQGSFCSAVKSLGLGSSGMRRHLWREGFASLVLQALALSLAKKRHGLTQIALGALLALGNPVAVGQLLSPHSLLQIVRAARSPTAVATALTLMTKQAVMRHSALRLIRLGAVECSCAALEAKAFKDSPAVPNALALLLANLSFFDSAKDGMLSGGVLLAVLGLFESHGQHLDIVGSVVKLLVNLSLTAKHSEALFAANVPTLVIKPLLQERSSPKVTHNLVCMIRNLVLHDKDRVLPLIGVPQYLNALSKERHKTATKQIALQALTVLSSRS